MTAPSRAESQLSMALDAIQSKRRVERLMEAATALLDRYAVRPLPADRVTTFYELVRRNLTPDIAVAHGDLALGPDGLLAAVAGTEATPAARPGAAAFHSVLTGPDGPVGRVGALYTPPGSLGLTTEEWQAGMVLLTGVLALGLGASAGPVDPVAPAAAGAGRAAG